MKKLTKSIVIITAAGIGQRMNAGKNKVLLPLGEEPVLVRTLRIFEKSSLIDEIILVTHTNDLETFKNIVSRSSFRKVKKIIVGGKERQDSVYNGLNAIDEPKDNDIILFHNGANPFVDTLTIEDCVKAAEKFGASVVGFRAKDTIKEVDGDGFIAATLDRSKLWQVQTPQVMKYSIAKKAFDKAYQDNFYGTDDVMLAERIGVRVKVVECSRENIKITTPRDLDISNQLVLASRVGFGMDSHRFTKDKKKKLILGGVEIPEENGFLANSDGDVILHALFNAVSQALGEKSIGHYADSMCEKGITDSSDYLNVILGIMRKKDFKISNIGIMIEAKNPNISDYEDKIIVNVAKLCHVGENQVGVTATSGEGLTDFGKGLGIQCFVTVLLKK